MTRTLATEKTRQRGFTLLELLLVLGILGMLATLSVPALRSLDGPGFNAQVRQASALLNNARRMAVVQGQTTRVEFEIAHANTLADTQAVLPPTQARLWRSENLELWYANSTESSQRIDERLIISFFPEGGSSGGELSFRQNDRERIVAIDPFTGRVSSRDAP